MSASHQAESDEDSIFVVEFEVYLREFKGQTSGPKNSDIVVSEDSLEQFWVGLFEKVQPLLKKELVIENGTYTFNQDELTSDDLDR